MNRSGDDPLRKLVYGSPKKKSGTHRDWGTEEKKGDRMILRGSNKPDPFIESVVRYVAGERQKWSVTKEGAYQVVYIGAGYWRAVLIENEDRTALVGIRLVNPDRTGEEIRTVERAVAILTFTEYEQD